ncbi:secretion protein EspK [Mycobacterium marinum]|uniref:secretion protein EspK n=1 Tax=Mycobacterium marinum TaxID=1781 RepID=UPI002358A07F|nr:secretion protein EspK [Mycobacterium marinum]MDC8983997.1 secretion protein EspK [Mycobacterium marinum]MDC9001072.1 secretion protein EspK [Mycobacterium marinum]MDC9011452.1 secretion protein EspK [Mycobacterium marinum]
MSIAKPTGEHVGLMLHPGGWPQADEDLFYARAQQYNQTLHRITRIVDTCRQQRLHVFEGGVWSGGAANAANGALGATIDQLMTVQDRLATVISWHRYVADVIGQAKAEIGNHVDAAHREIDIVERDHSLDAEQKTTAIESLVSAAHAANVGVVCSTAEQVLQFQHWKAPNNALEQLLDQKTPPPLPDTPPLGALPDTPPLSTPAPTEPPQTTPGIGANPTPQPPGSPVPPVTPAKPATAPPAATPRPAPSRPAVPAAALKPATSTDQTPVAGGASDRPAQADPSQSDAQSGVGVAPAAMTGMPPVRVAGAAPSGAGLGASTDSGSAGPATAWGRRSRIPGAPPRWGGPVRGRPAATPASAHGAAAAGAPVTDHTDRTDGPESNTAPMTAPIVPVAPARAARDAVAAGFTNRGHDNDDALRLARRIAAALNAPGGGADHDFGFFWITAVTVDGQIAVANSYGLAFIPDGVELPDVVQMASADHAIPAGERARCATYPLLAVQAWATHHDTTLRAVIGTAEQLADCDPGVAKIILEPDDIPQSGKMTGRSRLEVVNPAAATRLSDTKDPSLIKLLPPAPVAADVPADQDGMLWFEVMAPMASSAAGREAAHLRAFQAYAAHAQELALHLAHCAADPDTARAATADWLYWQHVAGLLGSALSTAA